MPTEELELSLHGLIRQEIDQADKPDIEAIASRVIEEMSEEELRHFALSGVKCSVRIVLANIRKDLSRSSRGAPSSSTRWDAVKATQESGDLDLQRYAIYTGRSRKWLLDCTPSDLTEASEYHMDLGNHHTVASEQLDNLASALRRAKKEVVGDLPENKVIGILSA